MSAAPPLPLGLCLLHGLFGAPSDWDAVVERLHAGGFAGPIVRPALGPTDGFAHTIATVETALAEAAPQGSVAWVWAGYSMGGRITTIAAARSPWVAGWVLLAGHPGEADADVRAERLAVDEERADRLLAEGPEAFLRQWYAMPMFAPLVARRGLAALLAARAHVDAATAASQLRSLSLGRQPAAAPPGAGAPLLGAVAGALDLTYRERIEAFCEARSAPLFVAPDAGHALLLEAPDTVARALFEALRAQQERQAQK